MLRRIDAWIGKTLFVPIIIRICQRFKMTQYAFHRYCWFYACLHGLYFADDWIGKVIFGIGAPVMCLMSAMFADVAISETRWFRYFILLTAPWFVLPEALFGENYEKAVYTLVVLFAEYATTIKTIPPLEAKERAVKGKVARQRA
jgi:hypothetical protein